jgi:predicted DNA-binding ribbon-helix-helix protein
MSSPVKRSVVVAGHQTSISLEEPFWEALVKIAKSEDVSLNSLITQIDRDRQGNLSSTLRVFVLKSLQEGQN